MPQHSNILVKSAEAFACRIGGSESLADVDVRRAKIHLCYKISHRTLLVRVLLVVRANDA